MMPCTTAKEGNDDLLNAGPLSPGSLKLPSLASWDLPTTTRSPALYTPPDINSILSGQYPYEENTGGPLSQMSEAVNNIDKIKPEDGSNMNSNPGSSKLGPHTPCTPGMPATPHTPGSGCNKMSPTQQTTPAPMSSSSSCASTSSMNNNYLNNCNQGYGMQNNMAIGPMSTGDFNNCQQNYHDQTDFSADGLKSDFSLDDLTFDPTYIIDNAGTDDLTLGDVDPDDLLSFLDPPPDLSTPPSSGSGMSTGGQSQTQTNYNQHHPGSNSNESNNPNSNLTDDDDLLSLIEYD